MFLLVNKISKDSRTTKQYIGILSHSPYNSWLKKDYESKSKQYNLSSLIHKSNHIQKKTETRQIMKIEENAKNKKQQEKKLENKVGKKGVLINGMIHKRNDKLRKNIQIKAVNGVGVKLSEQEQFSYCPEIHDGSRYIVQKKYNKTSLFERQQFYQEELQYKQFQKKLREEEEKKINQIRISPLSRKILRSASPKSNCSFTICNSSNQNYPTIIRNDIFMLLQCFGVYQMIIFSQINFLIILYYNFIQNYNMSSLFFKCMTCNQKPATIKCSECKPGQIYQICYACDIQIHNKKCPIDSQHKTEIMPYQEMYIKSQSAAGIRNQQTQSKPELKQKPQQQQQQIQHQQPLASASIQQFVTSQKMGKFDLDIKSIQQSKPNSASNKEIPKATQVQQNKSETLQQLTKVKNNHIGRQEDQELNSDQSKELTVQIKKEQEYNQKLKNELQQTKDQLQNINKDVEKRIQQNHKDLEKKINDLKKEYTEDKKKTEQLSDDIKKLKEQLRNTDQQANKKIDQQKKKYEQQLKQLEQVIQEKQDQIEEIAQEFSNYNFEEIQAKMEEMSNDNNQKDQYIEELQNQLQENKQGGRQNDNQAIEDEKLQMQLEQKDQEIQKLEELIENFKQLYQHMLDEKQALVDENEKLITENNQFRELFSQNLHLFGIDPDDLEDGEDDDDETKAEAEAEDYRQHDDDDG